MSVSIPVNEYVETLRGKHGPEMKKSAADGANDFTRLRYRDECLLKQILPDETVADNEIDRLPDIDTPVKWVELDINTGGSISAGFGTHPHTYYIGGRRYGVNFCRLMTPIFTKDVIELRTYRMDVRQIISNNAIKDLLTELDGKWIQLTNAIVGTVNTNHPETGTPMNVVIPGDFSRDNVVAALEILPRTRQHLPTHIMLMNSVTYGRVRKWGRDEAGGDWSQELAQKTYTGVDLFGHKTVVTIYSELVPDNTIFLYAEPQYMGKFYTMEDVTLNVKVDKFMFEFSAYCCKGCAVGNLASVAKVHFGA
jgi:hypothetical protein